MLDDGAVQIAADRYSSFAEAVISPKDDVTHTPALAVVGLDGQRSACILNGRITHGDLPYRRVIS
jgi:hypothetical protein